jgi:hypothetical protein
VLEPWASIALVGAFDGTPAQFELSFDESTGLTMWGNVLLLETQAVVWVATDLNLDGVVQANEIVDGALLDWHDRFSVDLRPDKYTVFPDQEDATGGLRRLPGHHDLAPADGQLLGGDLEHLDPGLPQRFDLVGRPGGRSLHRPVEIHAGGQREAPGADRSVHGMSPYRH